MRRAVSMTCLRHAGMLFMVGAALLGSSRGWAAPGDSFKTADEAALDAIDYLMKEHPDWKMFEYGGCIYKEGDGYKATLPVTQYSPKRCVLPDVPAGTLKMGDYHSHTSQEDFSPSVDLNTKMTWPSYLLTPSGQVKKHTFHDKKTVRLR